MKRLTLLLLLAACVCAQEKKPVALPSSKMLLAPVSGTPQRTNSLPVTLALSPDQRFAALLNNGYGTAESGGHQSIAILDLASNKITDFPDPRLGPKARQTYFLGLAFSTDGAHLYASIASLTDPEAKRAGSTGNGIAVYRFENGALAAERFIPIPLQPLAPGKRRAAIFKDLPPATAAPYPAGLAVIAPFGGNGERLLVADNLSDDALLIDAATGAILHRFDLSVSEHVPAAYPYGVAAERYGRRAWVTLWNASRVAELDLEKGKVARFIKLRAPKSPTQPGSHPSAIALGPYGGAVYVALANRDEVAALSGGKIIYLSTKLPGQKHAGSYPNAIVQAGDLLAVANASSDSVALFKIESDPSLNLDVDCVGGCDFKLKIRKQPMGFIPTEWYPTALAVTREGDLLVASGKAQGAGANAAPSSAPYARRGRHTYIASLLHGSVARINLHAAEKQLPALTREVLASNLMQGKAGRIEFKNGRNPIKHVIYVIKENRSYDQLFGDLKWGDGDASLVLYGEEITPNQHALARQFGILDNFYDSGEVSGDGHVWSTAAISSDYTEKTWQIGYRGDERSYDYEGRAADEYPLEQGIAHVDEPASGYLWTNLARHKRTYRHYGEFISTVWCDQSDAQQPPQGGTPLPPGTHCPQSFIKKGGPLPAHLGGGPSPWPWPVPIIARQVATKPELRDHFDPLFPDFRMAFPDQLRANEFLREFNQWVETRQKSGRDRMPHFITLRLPNDHTSGTSAGRATPAAAVADNDLALGRVVEAVSRSPYWNDTAIFVLEDDAQDGADHVDAHRSIALVISKYAPRTDPPAVHHQFYTTVNMIATMEALLGLQPMNNNDALAPLMAPLFSGNGDQAPFTADYRNRDNGLIYEMNSRNAPGAKESAEMNWSRADAVDTARLNQILWQDRKGDTPMPAPRHTVVPR